MHCRTSLYDVRTKAKGKEEQMTLVEGVQEGRKEEGRKEQGKGVREGTIVQWSLLYTHPRKLNSVNLLGPLHRTKL